MRLLPATSYVVEKSELRGTTAKADALDNEDLPPNIKVNTDDMLGTIQLAQQGFINTAEAIQVTSRGL
jgi:hypothetical protein